jgi:two-component system CheB/CheR fusion protein
VVEPIAHPVTVWADRVRLSQVFINLLTNAARHAGMGGTISIRPSDSVDEIDVTFSDSGPGVPPALRDRVFLPFVQGPTSLDRPHGGMGVGLGIARRIVEKHGGTLTLEQTADGRWANFVVRLSNRQPTDLAVKEPVDAGISGSANASLKILAVDDEPDIVAATATLLEIHGHDVRTALDAQTGLEIATEFKPDVVLSDIGLPGMDGYEFARRLKTETPAPYPLLIAVTGYGSKDDKQRAWDAGFEVHLVKPVPPEDLLRSLSKRREQAQIGELSHHPAR